MIKGFISYVHNMNDSLEHDDKNNGTGTNIDSSFYCVDFGRVQIT